MQHSFEFDDLRPCGDISWNDCLGQMLHDPEFLGFLSKYWQIKSPEVISRWIQGCRKKQEFHSKIMLKAIDFILQTTTKGLTTTGLEHLSLSQNYLFMSNHRDILLDSLLIGYALFRKGHPAPRMALGDNLLKMSWLGNLFHLNDSVVVRRNLKPKELLVWSKRLSHYIHHSVKNGHNFWIAQREGRAKDGIDQTSPGLIKMLGLHQKDLSGQAFSDLPIVPISISYEQDPCDVLKAKELCSIAKTGTYQKKEKEDERSMALGFTGQKGRVHIHFSKPITLQNPTNFREATHQVLTKVDEKIQSNYKLWPTHTAAYQILTDGHLSPQEQLAKSYLDQRCSLCSEDESRFLLNMYANPVKKQML